MSATGLVLAKQVVDAFHVDHFIWVPQPTIKEDPDWTTSRYHATATEIFIPHYTDSWNEGKPEILIHEFGHVVAWNSDRPIEGFLAALGADPTLISFNLINEVFAEAFARTYVDGYDGHNYPQLVNVVSLDLDKTKAFFESLKPIQGSVTNLAQPADLPKVDVPIPLSSASPSFDGGRGGLRYLADSTVAADIPPGFEFVGGYVDGAWAWTEQDWAMNPNSIHVRIACFEDTNDGYVGDVEKGDMTPQGLVRWVVRRRAAGIDPTGYCSIGMWQACIDAFASAGVEQPHWWIAWYDNDPTPLTGAIAKQYANPTWTHKHYDASVVSGIWPGVEMDRATFDQWFAENYKTYEVAKTFDELKGIQANQQEQLNKKPNIGDPIVLKGAKATVTFE
jgi:hypothetical protein